jgi:hypothetical protein
VRWVDRLDRVGQQVDQRWYAWLETRIRPSFDRSTEFVIAAIPVIGLLLLAYYLLSAVI